MSPPEYPAGRDTPRLEAGRFMSRGQSVPPPGDLAGRDTPRLETRDLMNWEQSVLPLDTLLVHECGNVVLDMLHVLVDC